MALSRLNTNLISDTKMNLNLNEHACAKDARKWLRQIVCDFGLGFHLDTQAADYVSDSEPFFSVEECASLDRSISVAFELLGEIEPYEICADEMYLMLSETYE